MGKPRWPRSRRQRCCWSEARRRSPLTTVSRTRSSSRSSFPSQSDVDKVVGSYDAAEYKRVEADGSITLNVFVTSDEEKALKVAGYKIGATIEDTNTGIQRMQERQELIDQDALAATVAEDGLKGTAKFDGQSVLPLPGDTVIQRANTFTDVVGPSGATTTARFLYVEAYNKSTKVTGTSTVSGPALAVSYAGADGVYSAASTVNRFVDTDPTPDVYMYHRQLIRLPADAPANITSVRISTTATAGGAAASVETFPSPSGSARASRRTSLASRTRRSSRTTWTRPRTARTWTPWRPGSRSWCRS